MNLIRISSNTQYQKNLDNIIAIKLEIAPRFSKYPSSISVIRLLGPLGLATLDSKDWAYRGDYDNSNQSDDKTIAQGANYHQGPEWLWPVGFLLRALIRISLKLGSAEQRECHSILRRVVSNLHSHLSESDWMGLPELTNRDGQECKDSNPIQVNYD